MAKRGFLIKIVVGDGKKDQEKHGVAIIDAGTVAGGRLERMAKGTWKIYCKARQLNSKVFHFHDPELLPIGILLKIQGKRVIYDVHENLPQDIMSKDYISPWIRKIVGTGLGIIEKSFSYFFDIIVVATPAISDRFPNHKTLVIRNFPLLDEFFATDNKPYRERPCHVGYIGGISNDRGIKEILKAMDLLPRELGAELIIAGKFSSERFKSEIKANPEWDKIKWHGWLNRSQTVKLLQSFRVGLVVLHPTQAYTDSYPIKLFEYMASGTPVVASDFPVMRKILDEFRCGLLVNPKDPGQIADALRYILQNPREAENMGRRGREGIFNKYNWQIEQKKLLSVYQGLVRS